MNKALKLLNSQLIKEAVTAQAENSPALTRPASETSKPLSSAGGLSVEEVIPRGRIGDRALPLVVRLCDALGKQGVNYCHWKSNWKLERWTRGEGDLDLLVDRQDAQRFTTVLSQLEFKQARPSRNREVPGIQHYYGFDKEAGRFVHLHVYYQLVLGHDLTDNYHLPIEKPYLETTVRQGLLPVPAPEFELVVFALRTVLKFVMSETILRRILSMPGTSVGAVRKELEYLDARSDRDQVRAVLDEHLPFVGVPFFDTCVQSLRGGYSGWRRATIRRQLERRLKAHARRSHVADILLKIGRRATGVFRDRIFNRSPRKRLAGGGTIIALVGGDGAGKTTAVNKLHGWLSGKFVVKRFHLGKPPRSPLTLAVIVALRARRLLDNMLKAKPTALRPFSDGSVPVFPGYLQLLRWVFAAWDRHRLYAKARRFAINGGIALCDRYPVQQIQLMDGPKIGRLVASTRMNLLVKFLLEREAGYHRQIMPPDLLIVLRLDPETAVRRKTDEDEEHVRTRSSELWGVDWQGTGAHVIDASQPFGEVIARLQSLVWAEL